VAAPLKVMHKVQRLPALESRTATILQSHVDVVDASNDHLLDLKATLCQAAARVGYSTPA
jgi:hypothetical protein